MGDSTNGHAATVRESIVAFNRGDAAAYASRYAEDATLIGPFFPEPLVGRAAIEETTKMMRSAFPGMHWTIVSLLEDGDHVACELHIEGTHEGALPTPAGEIPPTGRSVSIDTSEILVFDGEGRVVEHREYMDPGAFMTQLGLTESA